MRPSTEGANSYIREVDRVYEYVTVSLTTTTTTTTSYQLMPHLFDGERKFLPHTVLGDVCLYFRRHGCPWRLRELQGESHVVKEAHRTLGHSIMERKLAKGKEN
ncbi:hypothetical protein E2C01_063084 [Portunus trituberculatus]|uniref:Uncharacterized protein n=1 Tax=Portunus trituberculatus TaxID=210409 RepID=A0A5B7HJV6_PORTR|nr:hypothetical protein [Portunus trituberculatus]